MIPVLVTHATPARNVPAILENGLRMHKPTDVTLRSQPEGVYALLYGAGHWPGEVLIVADVAGLPVVEDEIAGDTIPDAVVVLAPIAPERIVLVATDDDGDGT